jgi:hypothetical protein
LANNISTDHNLLSIDSICLVITLDKAIYLCTLVFGIFLAIIFTSLLVKISYKFYKSRNSTTKNGHNIFVLPFSGLLISLFAICLGADINTTLNVTMVCLMYFFVGFNEIFLTYTYMNSYFKMKEIFGKEIVSK